MIPWLRRGTALAIFMLLAAWSFGDGPLGVAVAGGGVSLAWAMADKFTPSQQRLLAPCVLIVNTIASAYVVLSGGSVTMAVLVSGGALVSWNAGLFEQRRASAPLSTQYRYLGRVGGMFALGTAMGMSALALQGHFTLPFGLAFLMMLVAGFVCLRLISQASLQGWEER